MSIAHLLNQTAIWRRNQPTGDHGRFPFNPVVIDAALPVRKRIAGASDKTTGSQERGEATHVVYTEPDVKLRQGDLLYIDGRRHDVLVAMQPSVPPGAGPHHMKWTVEEQQYSTEDIA